MKPIETVLKIKLALFRTLPLVKFSKNQHKQISNCRDCVDGFNSEPSDNEWVDSFNPDAPIKDHVGPGFDVFDIHPKIRLSEITGEIHDLNINGDENASSS